MEPVSFWSMCRVTILSYIDSMARGLIRRGTAVYPKDSSPAAADEFGIFDPGPSRHTSQAHSDMPRPKSNHIRGSYSSL